MTLFKTDEQTLDDLRIFGQGGISTGFRKGSAPTGMVWSSYGRRIY